MPLLSTESVYKPEEIGASKQLLGLRRYKKVQIDIWQGDINSFAVDGVVELVSGTSERTCIQPSPANSSATATITVTVNTTGPSQKAVEKPRGSFVRDLCENIYQYAESGRLRHVALLKHPANLLNTEAVEQLVEQAMETFKECISNLPPRTLSRITFVANSAAMYERFQEHLFARFPDELDEEGH